MRHTAARLALALTLAVGSTVPSIAQQALPVPGEPAARDVPNAHEMPDPKLDVKVVFSIAQGAQKPGEVNPMLKTMALYLNTLAKTGVPADHRHLAAMFHQRSADFDIVMTNEAYKARYNGQDNPNIALIHALKQAGVDFRLCGQALAARKIDPKDVNPDIQIDLWAMTTMIQLQLKGYVRVG